jgi:hypothetical protein
MCPCNRPATVTFAGRAWCSRCARWGLRTVPAQVAAAADRYRSMGLHGLARAVLSVGAPS